MRLHLIENAIVSLTFGKDFYQKYFDLGDDKYLSEKVDLLQPTKNSNFKNWLKKQRT